MSILYDPKDQGFPEALSIIDRCQIAMLRELANATDGRLVLKGGMAMRVAVGSMRLTKDVDFDRAEGVSTASVQSSVKKALQHAAQSAGMRGAEIDSGKSTETTVRMRLAGMVAGASVRFVVEVSGRNPVPQECQTRVQVSPPSRYGIAPFVMTVTTSLQDSSSSRGKKNDRPLENRFGQHADQQRCRGLDDRHVVGRRVGAITATLPAHV